MNRASIYGTEGVRAAIGLGHDLIVDASMRYDLAIARRIGKVLEDNRVFWYEEPFASEDLDRYRELRGTVGGPGRRERTSSARKVSANCCG